MLQRNTVLALGALIVGGLLVGAGVGAAGLVGDGDAPQASGNQLTMNEANQTITVVASGSVQAEPDQAVVQLSVEARDGDPAEARAKVAANASSMRDALADLGLADDQVRSVGFNIYEDRQHPRNPEAEPDVTYRARHRFEVELDDVDRVGTVIDAAVDGGATTVNGVQFTLSDDTQRELQQDALRAAMDNARLQADTIAASAELTVTGVESVTTEDTRVPTHGVQLAMAEGDAGGTDIDPGDVTVSMTVTVAYGATE